MAKMNKDTFAEWLGVYTDIKPYSTGRYSSARQGEDCPIHF